MKERKEKETEWISYRYLMHDLFFLSGQSNKNPEPKIQIEKGCFDRKISLLMLSSNSNMFCYLNE